VLHTAIDSFKLVTLQPEATAALSALLIVVSLVVPLAVLPATGRAAARPVRACSSRTRRCRARDPRRRRAVRAPPG
jgi:hypothetical protein